MSDDIVERLRAVAWPDGLYADALDEIERLTAENQELRTGLAEIADWATADRDGPWRMHNLTEISWICDRLLEATDG